MPVEISCYYLIEAAKKMGCWQENDAYIPNPGDAILYDWQDNEKRGIMLVYQIMLKQSLKFIKMPVIS